MPRGSITIVTDDADPILNAAPGYLAFQGAAHVQRAKRAAARGAHADDGARRRGGREVAPGRQEIVDCAELVHHSFVAALER
jgi:hypothetical protein